MATPFALTELTAADEARISEGSGALFNSSLEGNVCRAIDIHEGEDVDEGAFKAVVRQAVALNK